MRFSIAEWHTRFTHQAQWTHEIRRFLFDRAGLPDARSILEVGCGTGALLPELVAGTSGAARRLVIGIDLDREFLRFSANANPTAWLAQADAHWLPFPAARFDIILCHFLLLWVDNPTRAVAEMGRVARPGGAVLALAEPDYGGRIDYPPPLDQLGSWQSASLRSQGADTKMGRRLASIFTQAGLQPVEFGILGGQWRGLRAEEEWDSEWATLAVDLGEWVSQEKLFEMRKLDAAAWQRGERVLYVPTFYAWGRAPG